MTDPEKQKTENQQENQQAVTAATTKQILRPSIFDNENIE